MFNGNNLPHELSSTTRQTTKLRNAIENNMSTDTKLSWAQISKKIQSRGFLCSLLSKLADLLIILAVPLAKNILAYLEITSAASAIDAGILKENTLFCKNNFNHFKQSNERHSENCPRSWRFQCFFWKELLKKLKMK